jgi:hypothetical protein
MPTFVLHDFQQGNRNDVNDGGLKTIMGMKACVNCRAGGLIGNGAGGPIDAEGSTDGEGPRMKSL